MDAVENKSVSGQTISPQWIQMSGLSSYLLRHRISDIMNSFLRVFLEWVGKYREGSVFYKI